VTPVRVRRQRAHREFIVAHIIRPIRNEGDHKAALARLEEIWDPEPGTAAADEFEVLGVLVEDYERQHIDIPDPTPLEAIQFRMEQGGHTRKDLERLLGSRARVAEVLKGTRGLSIEMVRALHDEWGIPADILIKGVRSTTRYTGKAKRGARSKPKPKAAVSSNVKTKPKKRARVRGRVSHSYPARRTI
jgi:HTH-type transcriptional regulator / antitoxin HigA